MLTHERLLEVLTYDPASGIFNWRAHKTRRATPEQREGVAGWVNDDGYRTIRVDGKLYLAHRLAWFFVHNVWPAEDTDHKNGTPGEDGIKNLRACSTQQNTWNSRISKANSSGFKGVSWDKKRQKWRACIRKDGQQKLLGRFNSPEAAHAAYVKAAIEQRGEFARVA